MIDGNGFLKAVEKWLAWVGESQPHLLQMRQIAASKPRGLHHDSNLILDSAGQVWQSVWSPVRGYARLERDALYGQYTKTADFLVDNGSRAYNGGPLPFQVGERTFVAKGWDRPEEDWSWVPERYGGGGTLAYYEGSVRRGEAGIRLGTALIALDPETLDSWAAHRASLSQHDGRLRSNLGDDWASLTAAFGLPSSEDVPDHGSLECHAHLLVDRHAGLKVNYAF